MILLSSCANTIEQIYSVDYSSGNIDHFRILKTCDAVQDFKGSLAAMSVFNLLELHLTWDDDEYKYFRPFFKQWNLIATCKIFVLRKGFIFSEEFGHDIFKLNRMPLKESILNRSVYFCKYVFECFRLKTVG